MRAMLLCAGLSTRLGKLGAECPKPLLPVCGVPILHYGIANLVAHGIRDLVVNTHHRAGRRQSPDSDRRAHHHRQQAAAQENGRRPGLS